MKTTFGPSFTMRSVLPWPGRAADVLAVEVTATVMLFEVAEKGLKSAMCGSYCCGVGLMASRTACSA
jgi:hypothetical protein